MDASAIITQVARDDDRHQLPLPRAPNTNSTNSNVNCNTNSNTNSNSNTNTTSNNPNCNSTTTTRNDRGSNSDHNDSEASACVGLGNSSKKSGSTGFLRSLLCCWGGGGGRGKGPPSTTTDGTPTSPLVLTTDPSRWLLPPVRHQDMHKKCMVIDLDETLVHSSFKPINNADFVVPVEIDGTVHQVYVLKRPHVDEFLRRAGELYECVLFTASLAKYADPVADLLDRWGVFRARLFRESCVIHHGNYVKDLNKLGRDLRRVVIVDNSPASYIFHPDNAVPVASWFDDMTDSELLNLIPFFEKLSKVDSVYTVLCNSNRPYNGSDTPRGGSPS